MMLLVAILVAVLVLAVAVVVGVGAALPRGHEATRSAQLSRGPQEVWDTITDVDRFPQWRPRLKKAERLPDVDGRARWREYSGRDAITFEVTEAVPPARLVARIADEGLPFGGSWAYEITPAADGCVLTVTEHGEVYNPVFRFVSRFVLGHGATMETYLKALGRRFGEEVAVRS